MSKRSQRRRTYSRNLAHAKVRRMVELAEQNILRRARLEGRVYCDFTVPSSEWIDKAGTVHITDPAPCNGRMRPVREHGATSTTKLKCDRCGRLAIIALPPSGTAALLRQDDDEPEMARRL